MRRLACRFLAAAAIPFLLFAVATAGAEDKSRLDTVLERGKLIVVVGSAAPPFAFTDGKGELVGFDIDIVRLLATALFKDPTTGLCTITYSQVSGITVGVFNLQEA